MFTESAGIVSHDLIVERELVQVNAGFSKHHKYVLTVIQTIFYHTLI